MIALLLLHMQLVSYVASVAADGELAGAEHRDLRIQLVGDAGAAMLVLLAAIALSIYKPRGMTRRGRRALCMRNSASSKIATAGPTM